MCANCIWKALLTQGHEAASRPSDALRKRNAKPEFSAVALQATTTENEATKPLDADTGDETIV